VWYLEEPPSYAVNLKILLKKGKRNIQEQELDQNPQNKKEKERKSTD